MRSHDDLERWARDRTTDELRAGGREVLGAGELVLARVAGRWSVAQITNQSTGYCPDATSSSAVAAALDRAGIARPARSSTRRPRCRVCRWIRFPT